MRRSYFIILFGLFMVTALGGYAAIKAGVIPVALVNKNFVTAKDFNESVASIEHYYRETGGKIASIEVRRATLDKLIENSLIKNELVTRMTEEELASVVSQRIGALEEIKTSEFKGKVTSLYGITADRFQELVLVPKAREEVLASEVARGGSRFEDAVVGLRKNAKVRILVPGLHWENSAVIVRGR